jgi:hypothetical protein
VGESVNVLLLKVGEALVTYEVLLLSERNEVSALALASEEVGILSSLERHKTSEVVLAVKLKQGLESWQTVEVEGVSWLSNLDLGSLSFKHYHVLLVTWAESEGCRQLGCGDGKIPRVAEVVLSLDKWRAGDW